MRTSDHSDFPQFGARARSWLRFERELRRWMDTPDGRFAQWRACRSVAVGDAAPTPDHVRDR